jgi:magnesium-transporting ATPase (P-type)
MSVIIQDINDNIILYCKGADSVIFERLNEKSQSIIEQTREDLDGFGREGLRTLVMA